MKQSIRNSVYLLALTSLLLMSLTLSCTDRCEQTPARPLIVVSIEPVGDWLRFIAGDDFDVAVIIPPSSNPHTFELTPKQMTEASRASAGVFVGAGFEPWLDRLLENVSIPDSALLMLTGNRNPVADKESSTSHRQAGQRQAGHRHNGNPHIWLDPVMAITAVSDIAEMLATTFPDRAKAIRSRARSYSDSLKTLNQWIEKEIDGWREKRFVADHASWKFFARRYGLEETGILERVPGREISARELAALIKRMKQQDVSAIFANGRSPSGVPDMLARETDASVARLYTITAPGLQDADHGLQNADNGLQDADHGSQGTAPGLAYLELLRYNVRAMNEVMK